MKVLRLFKHLFVPDWLPHRAFTPEILSRIEEAITASEKKHRGELRFVAEASLPLAYLFLKRRSSRRRAEDLFASLRVWDTEENSGVLIYVQLVSRHIDIVADRGIARRVAQPEWEAVCRAMEEAFRRGEYLEGSLRAVESVTHILARHFPPGAANPNELPDRPAVL